MMRNLKYTAVLSAAALAVAALFSACTTDPTEEAGQTPPPQLSDMPIRWEVKEVASSSIATRALIGNDRSTDPKKPDPAGSNVPNNPAYFLPLTEACATDLATDPLKSKGFAVGLFGDYTYEENGVKVTEYDLYRGARLVYLPKETKKGAFVGWDTDVGMRYWHPAAEYIFRAYYPQRLYNYTVSNSNATTLALVYPSRKLQYDLLIGAVKVNTKTNSAVMSKAVPITLNHALAALRFEFKLDFAGADFLTSLYLRNDKDRDFFSQGTITYGDKDNIESITWLQDYNPPEDEDLYKWVPPLKYWYGIDEDEAGEKDGVFVEKSADEMLKYWGWGSSTSTLKPADNPVMMYSNAVALQTGEDNTTGGGNDTPEDPDKVIYTGQFAKAYYGMDNHYDETPGSETYKTWVDNPKEEVAVEGTLYCRNSGWLLIPPQQSYGKLTLYFTTKKGGRAIYKVALPVKTGTLIGKDGRALKDDATGKFITKIEDLPAGTEGVDGWASGVRYTYLVTLSETNLEINVSIDPWNVRKHSTEIIF